MAHFVSLFTATLLTLLAVQAEPITAVIGLLWAGFHILAAVKYWHDIRD